VRLVTALVLAAALCAATPAGAKAKPKKPPPAATPTAAAHAAVTQLADGWRTDLALPGTLLGWALPRGKDGHRTLFLLVGPKTDTAASCAVRDSTPKPPKDAELFRWRFESPEKLEALGSGFPSGSLDSADVNADGEDDLLLQREGGIDLVAPSADGTWSARSLVDDAQLGATCCGPRMAWDAAAEQDTALRVALLGAFRSYGPGRDGGVGITSELETPERVRGGAERVLVGSPAVRPIGKSASSRMVFATDPEPLGRRRLRTLLLDPDGPAEAHVVESWALFPVPESVVDSAFALLHGSPVLIVTTTSADKLSLLGEKALRIFPLGGDRTRAGDAPVFSATTGINLWQRAYPAVLDLDGDGRDDLVLAYWKGLQSSIAALEVYKGGAASGFAKPRSTSFDVDDGEKAFMAFGRDVDGDGRPDLILFAKRELLVYPGSEADRAIQKPVASRASRRIPLAPDLPRPRGNSVSMGLEGFQIQREWGGLGEPHLLDLDGDGRPEAVFAGDGASGGRVSVVFVRGSSAGGASATIPRE
jgi:hypothetical protein